MSEQQYKEIEIDKIVIPEERARATFTPEQEKELEASIVKNGFTVPILVRPLQDDKYELIDGEHRIQVVKKMGWTKIPAIVTTADEKRAAVLNFLANTARGTQNPIDISEALSRAKDAGATIDELSAATGHTKFWVEFYLKLKDLPDVYRNALKDMRLPVGVVKEALRLPNPTEVDALLGTALQLGWTVDTTRIAVNNRLEELAAAKKRAELTGEPPKVSEPDFEKLTQYDECMTCKRKFPRGTGWMKLMCPDCVELLQYILDLFGDPKEAMDYVYKAIKNQMELEKYQELKKKFEPETKESNTESGEEYKFPGPISG